MRKVLLFLGLIVTLNGCEKESINIIKPLSYFPVYPGSHWEYLEYRKIYLHNNTEYVRTDSFKTMYTVSLNYLPHSYPTGTVWKGSKLIEQNSEILHVPFLNGEPIYQYSKVKETNVSLLYNYKYYTKYPFLSETVGDTVIPFPFDPKHSNVGPYLVTHSKTVDKKNDSIIIVRGHYLGSFLNGTIQWLTYKKNVGLISHFTYSPLHNDTIYGKVLIDFEINKK